MNYDFLTVEDYNNILNAGYYVNNYYHLPFNVLEDLDTGIYRFDGFILINKKSDNNYFLTIENRLFTGGYGLYKAPYTEKTIINEDTDLFVIELNIDSRDYTNGSLILLMSNLDNYMFAVGDIWELHYICNDIPNVIVPMVMDLEFQKNIQVFDMNGDIVPNTDFRILEGGFKSVDVSTDANGVIHYTGETYADIKGLPFVIHADGFQEDIPVGLFYVIGVKTKPYVSLSDESILFKGLKKAKLIIDCLEYQTFDYELVYNNRRITGTKAREELTIEVDLDLTYFDDDELSLKLKIQNNYMVYSNEYNFNINVDDLTGDLLTLYQMDDYKPTRFHITEPLSRTGAIITLSDCIITSEPNIENTNIQINAENITFKNTIFNDSILISKADKSLILENCKIQYAFITIEGSMTLSDCEIENIHQITNNNRLELNNCILTQNEYYPNVAFIKTATNSNLSLNNCQFNLEYITAETEGLFKLFFDINSESIINGLKGKQLTDKFPFTNNKSNIDLTYGTTHMTGINGVTWAIDSTGKMYSQNITIVEE